MHLWSQCGQRIVVTGNRLEHLRAHPVEMNLLREAVGRLNLPTTENFYKVTLDFGRIIGQTMCVAVSANSAQFFAKRHGRQHPTRVVIGVTKPDCQLFTIVLKKGRLGDWMFITGYVGGDTPREPHDPTIQTVEEFIDCLRFWTDHALIHDPELMSDSYVSTWQTELEKIAA
jgi:hypothetical protein